MSSQFVSLVSIGVGALALLAGLGGWFWTRSEVLRLRQQQAASKRMVMPPSVSDVERYAGAKARLRLLRRRSYLFTTGAGVGVIAGALGVIAGWPRPAPPRPLVQAAAVTRPAPAVPAEADQARQLMVRLGQLCRTERRKCLRLRKDIGPIVASVCHFHPQICGPQDWPPALIAPSARDRSDAPRIPRPVLQTLTHKAAAGTLAWSDLELALP